MNIVFFSHPDFLNHQSMPRFVNFLNEGMKKRGHQTSIWSPAPMFFNLPVPGSLTKWLGYIDQYLVFPLKVKKMLSKQADDTIFVITDNALGPWVPLIATKPHVIHCHDFLAQRSALGQIPENPTGWTGKQYQDFIRRGYTKGSNFISVSEKTREDLNSFLTHKPVISEVVYNGMNQSFNKITPADARVKLTTEIKVDVSNGYILHVGGNQWYKNRSGVVEIYNTWRSTSKDILPLLMVGAAPDLLLEQTIKTSPFKNDIHIIAGKNDEFVRAVYAGASVFLFPSMDEGFGWPIAEAMASGCPVITTMEAPMTEVGGNAAIYMSRRPLNQSKMYLWTVEGSNAINKALGYLDIDVDQTITLGYQNVKRFDPDLCLDQIEAIYINCLKV